MTLHTSLLPIEASKELICKNIIQANVLLIGSEPGSGKTTRIPSMAALCAQRQGGGPNKIWVLEPRRAPAQLSAFQLAKIESVQIGGQRVGYETRGDSKSTANTQIVFMTYGVFLKKIQDTKQRSELYAVILDEFHERSLEMDLAWVICQKFILKTIVLSATLELGVFEKSGTKGLTTLFVPGKMYDVNSIYDGLKSKNIKKYFGSTEALEVAEKIKFYFEAFRQRQGLVQPFDDLVFLPGKAWIEKLKKALEQIGFENKIVVLHGDLDVQKQAQIIANVEGPQRLILSTAISETSVTLPRVISVYDLGLARMALSCAETGGQRLETLLASKSAIKQRKGRAGRVRPGQCVHFYSKADHQARASHATSEIERTGFERALLTCLGLGLQNISDLNWLEVPSMQKVQRAKEALLGLGFIKILEDQSLVLTDWGRWALALPLSPRLGAVWIKASLTPQLKESEVQSILEKLLDLETDVSKGWLSQKLMEAHRQIAQSQKSLLTMPNGIDPNLNLKEVWMAGFWDCICKKKSSQDWIFYTGKILQLDPSLEIPEQLEWILCLEVFDSKITAFWPISESDLWESAYSPLDIHEQTEFVAAQKGVYQVTSEKVGQILVSQKSSRAEPSQKTTQQILDYVKSLVSEESNDWPLKQMSSFFSRIRFGLKWNYLNVPWLLTWQKQEPNLCDGVICEWICNAIGPQAKLDWQTWTDLEKELVFGLKNMDPGFNRFDNELPMFLHIEAKMFKNRDARIEKIPIRYDFKGDTWAESRIQSFFGLSHTPKLAGGRLPLKLHLLGPHHRALQITSDLASFWQKTYPQLRKELSRDYPKHYWPEDPINI